MWFHPFLAQSTALDSYFSPPFRNYYSSVVTNSEFIPGFFCCWQCGFIRGISRGRGLKLGIATCLHTFTYVSQSLRSMDVGLFRLSFWCIFTFPASLSVSAMFTDAVMRRIYSMLISLWTESSHAVISWSILNKIRLWCKAVVFGADTYCYSKRDPGAFPKNWFVRC